MTADRPPLAEGVPDRLYGRRRSHPLRARQQQLLDATLPRLRLDPAQAADPRAAFGLPVEALWLEVGFGGGEHMAYRADMLPDHGFIGCEPFLNGVVQALGHIRDGALGLQAGLVVVVHGRSAVLT
jgi:tRNA (guanine-N7-)-methyltransferase